MRWSRRLSFLACALALHAVLADVFEWDDALRYIDFDKTASASFELYSPDAFATNVKIYGSGNPALGAYDGHAWNFGTLTYILDVREASSDIVDVKLGFAEVYKPNCRPLGRIMSVTVNEKTISSVNIFQSVGCFEPHDIVFEGVSGSSPITISIDGLLQNPMLSNIVVRRSSSASSTLPPSTTPAVPSTTPAVPPTTPAVPPTTSAVPSMTPAVPSTATTVPSPIPTQTLSSSFEPGQTSVSKPFNAWTRPVMLVAGLRSRYRDIPGTNVFKADKMVRVEGTVRPDAYLQHRYGKSFAYLIKGRGTYEVEIGFAETEEEYCSGEESRVFSVSLNGDKIPELEDLDVYQKVGCRRAFIWRSRSVKFFPRLYIAFTAKKGPAMVSYIMVRPLQTKCIPESTADGMTSDHMAHAVPGQYPPIHSQKSPRTYVDQDHNGYENVLVNGDGSHTHFFDVINGITGRVTSYEWTSPDTDEFISDKTSFPFKFMLGTTRLLLRVKDNVCSSHAAETAVTVTGSMISGSYCYFYPGQDSLPEGTGVDQLIKPSFAQGFPDTSWNFGGLPFSESVFAARCIFFLEVDEDVQNIAGSVNTKGSGVASVFRGADPVLTNVASASFSVPLVANLSSYEVQYVHSKSGIPGLVFAVDARLKASVSYDRSTTFPVITSLNPVSSSTLGTASASVKVIGRSARPVSVSVGNEVVPVSREDTAAKRIFFDVPPSNTAGPTSITVNWEGGVSSNILQFTYLPGPAVDRISFTEKVMKELKTGKKAKSEFATAVRIGTDGNLYLGTLGATVVKLSYSMSTLTVTHRCGSQNLLDTAFSKNGFLAQRDILGLVFDPRDTVPRPYVTTQTLFWFDKNRIDPDNVIAWRNGAVDRLKPGSDANDDSICLVYDKRVVSNLPVSNHDHGVNGLEFTQSGDLLIAVGGFTNAGLPGKGLGERWEVPLCASILLAKLSRGDEFNGVITYSNDTHPHLGKVTGGDVEVVATGLRNAFFLSLHSSGRLYTMDNGPNGGFGHVALDCTDVDRNIVYPKDKPSDWPGRVKLGPKWDPYSVARPDKLLYIKQDGSPRFYGHPNLSRKECSFIDPWTNLDPLGNEPSSNYVPPLQMFTSSVNAVIEYHAGNVFNGALQGQLIISTFKNRKTYSFPAVTKPGERSDELSVLSKHGGLSATMNARGDIILPRIKDNNILVLRPEVPNLEAQGILSITAVTPFRHGKNGGTIATIGGYNFGTTPPVVKIGRRRCRIRTLSSTTITCTVPPAAVPGTLATVTVRTRSGEVAKMEKALWYMSV